MTERPVDGVEPATLRDLPLPHAWWLHVVQGKRCAVCRTDRDLEGHHVIERNALKRERPDGAEFGGRKYTLEQLLWHPCNGVPVCELCHVRHTRALRRIRADELPPLAFKFARLIGMEHRVGERYYPCANH